MAEGRLAQRESACFTRKRSQVQSLHRPLSRCAPKWRNGRRAAFRAQCPKGRGGSNPPFGTRLHMGQVRAPILRARSSVRIERSPAEAEVVGSSPTERATLWLYGTTLKPCLDKKEAPMANAER